MHARKVNAKYRACNIQQYLQHGQGMTYYQEFQYTTAASQIIQAPNNF